MKNNTGITVYRGQWGEYEERQKDQLGERHEEAKLRASKEHTRTHTKAKSETLRPDPKERERDALGNSAYTSHPTPPYIPSSTLHNGSRSCLG